MFLRDLWMVGYKIRLVLDFLQCVLLLFLNWDMLLMQGEGGWCRDRLLCLSDVDEVDKVE